MLYFNQIDTNGGGIFILLLLLIAFFSNVLGYLFPDAPKIVNDLDTRAIYIADSVEEAHLIHEYDSLYISHYDDSTR